MKKYIRIYLVLALVVPSFLIVQASQGRAVTWTPRELQITAFPGTSQAISVGLVSTRELQGVSLFVVPEIARFISIESTGLNSITLGQPFEFPALVQIPSSTALGRYEGTVHLRVNRQTIPDTLKVVINVIAPSSNIIPLEPPHPRLIELQQTAKAKSS